LAVEDTQEESDPFESAQQAVQSGQCDAVIIFSPNFAEQLAQFRAGFFAGSQAGSADDLAVKVPQAEIVYDAARDESRIAHDRAAKVLEQWRNLLVRQNLEQNKIPVAATKPFDLKPNNVALEDQQRAAVWSKILPFVLLIWALTGAFYPAIDLCAGEKERGTLETLLSSPAGRSEIVWGKLLTIMLFSMATSLLNLICMGITATLVLGQFTDMAAALPGLELGLPPLAVTAWLIVALVPISALFSALSLALAALAGSAKEGQYYLMPLLMITMPLMLLPMLPSVQLDLGTSLVPVTGVMLLLQALMESQYTTAAQFAVPVIGVTAACCLLAIRWAVDQFNNESVLFRESERLDLGLWIRHLVRDRGDLPTVAEALFCGVILLVIRFFANFQFSTPESWNQLATMTLISQVAFFAAPALLMAVILTRSPRKTLLLRAPAWSTLPVAVILAVVLHPVVIMVAQTINDLYPISEGLQQILRNLPLNAPNLWFLLLVLAITPAICEELAFRGFILSGLGSTGRKWQAIVLSSLFFGVTHGILQQSIMASLVGIIIGYVAVQTGSLFPCMLFHAAHNSLAILFSSIDANVVSRIPGGRWLLVSTEQGYIYSWQVVLVGALLSLMLLFWLKRLPARRAARLGSLGPNRLASGESLM